MSCPVPGSCGAGSAEGCGNADRTGRVRVVPSCWDIGTASAPGSSISCSTTTSIPHCLDSGIVRFDGRYFGALWALCKARELVVVADIHVHPRDAGQSESDRAHPMISCAGHIALILPRFGAEPLRRREIGIYRYNGRKRWTVVPAPERRYFFHFGF